MGHKSKSKSTAPDMLLAARTILSLLRNSPTNPPRESDLSSTLTRNIRSARMAVPLAKVLLPNWTLLWMLVETAMREEHLAVIVGWLEKVWEIIVGGDKKHKKGKKNKYDYEGEEAGYYVDDYGNKYGQTGAAAEYYGQEPDGDYGRYDGYQRNEGFATPNRGVTW